MGMFDEVRCDYPLPGTPPEFIKPGHLFQTKDLNCLMEEYAIDAGGVISIPEFTGTIGFYTSNICGTGAGVFTENGEDAESVAYRGVFVGSKIVSLTETRRTKEPAFPVSKMRCSETPDPEAVRAHRERIAAPMVGKRLFMEYGKLPFDDEERGFWVEVVAESDRELCLKVVDPLKSHERVGTLKVEPRILIDSILFDSQEDAKADRDERDADWKRRQDEYAALVESRKSQPADIGQ